MDVEGSPHSSVEIVDGQQRLTTIVLLLDGIQRLLAESSNNRTLEWSEGIRKRFISIETMSGSTLYKLTLNTDTDHFFKTSILSDTPNVEGPQVSSGKTASVNKGTDSEVSLPKRK